MKLDGVIFLAVVVGIIGIVKVVWNYINLFYEVHDLRRRLGKE